MTNFRGDAPTFFWVVILVLIATIWPDFVSSADVSYRISPSLLSLKYEEPGVMDESGTLSGMNFQVETRMKGWYGGLVGEAYEGGLAYDGALLSGSPVSGPTDDSLYRAEVFVGPTVSGRDAILRPYLGIGWRHWENDLREVPGGYRREITYQYFPLGIVLRPDNRNFELRFQRNIWNRGRTLSRLNDGLGCEGSPPGLPVEHLQRSGQGNNFSVTYFFAEGYTFDVSYRSWDVERSDVQEADTSCDGTRDSAFIEPANQTRAYYFGLGVSF